MNKIWRQFGAGAVLLSSSAWATAVTPASSYTYSFDTFFDTSTSSLYDTKTLGYAVAKLTLTDVAGGVQLTLTELSNAFPAAAASGLTYLDALWLNGVWGAVSAQSGATLSITSGGSSTPILLDGGYTYNGAIKLTNGGIAEGSTAVLTILGSGVSAYSFASSVNLPMLQVNGVGAPYSTSTSSKVHFLGTLIDTPAVPEPASWAFMLLGGVALTAAVRRRA